MGLLLLSAQTVGCDLTAFDDNTYGRVLPQGKLEEALDRALVPSSLHVGAVALLTVAKLGPTHVGIVGEVGGRLTLIHAAETRGGVVEHSLDSHMRAAIVKTYSLPTD